MARCQRKPGMKEIGFCITRQTTGLPRSPSATSNSTSSREVLSSSSLKNPIGSNQERRLNHSEVSKRLGPVKAWQPPHERMAGVGVKQFPEEERSAGQTPVSLAVLFSWASVHLRETER